MSKNKLFKIYMVTYKGTNTLIAHLIEDVEQALVMYVDMHINEEWVPQITTTMGTYLTLYGSVEEVSLLTTVKSMDAAVDFINLQRLILD
jgi:hypothetical protein